MQKWLAQINITAHLQVATFKEYFYTYNQFTIFLHNYGTAKWMQISGIKFSQSNMVVNDAVCKELI